MTNTDKGAVVQTTMNAGAVLATMETVDACLHSLNMDADTKAMHITRFSEARAFFSEMMAENEDMKKLLRAQEQVMTAYRELIEHRNRQIIALGGEEL